MKNEFDFDRLRADFQRHKGRKTLRQVSDEMGGTLSLPTLHRTKHRKHVMDVRTILIICDWMGVPASRYMSPPPETREVP